MYQRPLVAPIPPAVDSSPTSGVLSLTDALQELSRHPFVREWTPEKSVFMLLHIFCLPELDQVLSTVGSLSSKVNDKSVRLISLILALEGQVAQFAALLLFKWDSLVPNIHRVLDTKKRVTLPLPTTINTYKALFQLHKVFDRPGAGDLIHAYRKSEEAKIKPRFLAAFALACKFCKKSLDDPLLKITRKDTFSDDIPCLSPRLNPIEKDPLNKVLRRLSSSSLPDLRSLVAPIPPADDKSSSDTSPPSVVCSLCEALQELSRHPFVREWAPEKSVFKLLYIFCLPELDQVLNTIKSLSSKVNGKIVQDIAIAFVLEGQVAQFAAILLFAWDSIVPLIKRMLDFKRSLTLPSTINIYEALCGLYVVLYRARDVIHAYRQSWKVKRESKFMVAFDVARGFWRKSLYDPNLRITPKDIFSDDIPCLSPRLNPKEKDALNKDLRRLSSSSLPDLFRMRNRPTSDPDVEGLGVHIRCLGEEEDEDFLRYYIVHDYSDPFVEYFNKYSIYKKPEKFIRFLGNLVVMVESVNCLLAILDGETGEELTVEHTIPADAPDGWTLLHEAARHGYSQLIAVLLEREFADAANTKVDYPDLNLVQAVPLDLALSHASSCYKDWGGGKSAVGLIVALYQTSMISALEAVELLAPETNDIQQRFDRYKMDGKIVEVGLLLMAAHKQLLASSHLDGGAETTADLYSLPSENVKDTISSEIDNQCQPQRKETLREMKALLNIFNKVGHKLRAYRRLGDRFEGIAAIIEDAGLSVTQEDAYTCYAFRSYGKGFQQFLKRKIMKESWDWCFGLNFFVAVLTVLDVLVSGAETFPFSDDPYEAGKLYFGKARWWFSVSQLFRGSSLGKPGSVRVGDFLLSADIKPLFIVKGDKIWSPSEESFI